MSLINKHATRKTILSLANSKYTAKMADAVIDSAGRQWEYARANAARKKGQFTQVSIELLQDLDVHMRVYIETYLDRNPQKGKTVK